MQNSAIEMKNLSFQYDTGSRFRLEIPNWQVQSGEKVFLYGPSGSGKTTLLGLLTGVLSPTSGSLRLLGKNFTELSVLERDRFRAENLGYIFQQLNLLPYLSVSENILLSAWNSKTRGQNNRWQSAKEMSQFLMQRLEIADLREAYPQALSIGQQQRVAVARALMGPPRILIADEPTSALDEDRQAGFIQLLLELVKEFNVSTVFVSHHRSLAKYFDREVSINEITKGNATDVA